MYCHNINYCCGGTILHACAFAAAESASAFARLPDCSPPLKVSVNSNLHLTPMGPMCRLVELGTAAVGAG
jgi:hypothetical protein